MFISTHDSSSKSKSGLKLDQMYIHYISMALISKLNLQLKVFFKATTTHTHTIRTNFNVRKNLTLNVRIWLRKLWMLDNVQCERDDYETQTSLNVTIHPDINHRNKNLVFSLMK